MLRTKPPAARLVAFCRLVGAAVGVGVAVAGAARRAVRGCMQLVPQLLLVERTNKVGGVEPCDADGSGCK